MNGCTGFITNTRRIIHFNQHMLFLFHIYIKLRCFAAMQHPLCHHCSHWWWSERQNRKTKWTQCFGVFATESSSARSTTMLIRCPITWPVLTPQSFINTLRSFFCIITMLTLIHSHLIAMIRLHLMLLHRSHLSSSLHLCPTLCLIMDFLQILLVCDADQVSHFGFMNPQTSLL